MDKDRLRHLIMKYQPCGKRSQRRALKRLIDYQRDQNRSRGLNPCKLHDDHDEQKNNLIILKAQFLPRTIHTVLVKGVSVGTCSLWQPYHKYVSKCRNCHHKWGVQKVTRCATSRTVPGSIPGGVTSDFFRGSFRQNHVPWGRLSLWKWVPGISPGVKATGAYG